MPEMLPPPRYCGLCGNHLAERYIDAEKRTRLVCEGCASVQYVNPRVVASVVVSHRRSVLLQQRAIEPRAGYWTFPGGFLEMGETPLEGAIRETKEEVGVDIEPESLLGVYARPQAGIVLIVYRGESASADAFVGDGESSQVRWFGVDDIPWEELAFETTEAALRDWLRERR